MSGVNLMEYLEVWLIYIIMKNKNMKKEASWSFIELKCKCTHSVKGEESKPI